jgi:RHS repeat-associated protein
VERPKEGAIAEIKDTYAYDGSGLRASQTISGTTTYLVWDGTEELPLILSDTTNSYIYGPGGLPVEQISSGGTVTYLHHDQQGSTRLLTGPTGMVTGSTTFDPYGNTTGSTRSGTTPLGYDGQYTSTDTGLIYLRAREYDPATAQFLTVDPLVGETGARYNYAEGDPPNVMDPSGLYGCGNIPFVSDGCEVLQETGISDAAATALNYLTLGASTHLAGEVFGFNAECADFGTAGKVGTALGVGIGFFDGEDELEIADAGLDGSFSTFDRDESGAVSRYTTYGPADPRDPEEFRPTLRYDAAGKAHFNKTTGEYVDTPHMHDPSVAGGVREPTPEETP